MSRWQQEFIVREEIAVSGETVTDMLTDLAVYAIITRVLYEDLRCNI